MNFKIGDRVRCIIGDEPSLYEGEYGTVVKLRKGLPPIIEWDDYNKERHDADGLVPCGHGWFVFSNNHIELVTKCINDFGDIPDACSDDITKFLFDT